MEPRFAYAAPFYAQAKDVAWNYVRRFASPIPGAEFNESELRVDFRHNGSRVRLYGLDNYDRMRGIYLDGVVLDEYGDADPRAWSEVIRPALSDRAGWAVFIGTPKGANHFRDLWRVSANDADWMRLQLKASETGLLDPAELDDARRSMTDDQYAQEFECSFEAAIYGAYYAREMARIDQDKRIRSVPWEPNLPVYTAWDLGVGDSTAIWFAQQAGREARLIDYYEASGVGLDHYAKVLREKPYAYAREAILPHDAAQHELGTGTSRVSTLRSLGIGARVLPIHGVADGINAARLFLARCWFDDVKCARGIEALRNYRRDYDEKAKAFRERPRHDWASHGADAFRYLAAGLREEVTAPPQAIADNAYDISSPPKYRGDRQSHAEAHDPLSL